MEPTYKIEREKDHYKVYIDGVFYCSADTFNEAVEAVEEFCRGH